MPYINEKINSNIFKIREIEKKISALDSRLEALTILTSGSISLLDTQEV